MPSTWHSLHNMAVWVGASLAKSRHGKIERKKYLPQTLYHWVVSWIFAKLTSLCVTEQAELD